MAVSDAIATAQRRLLRVIPKPLTAKQEAQRLRSGAGLPDIDTAAFYDRARQFVDAISASPAAIELKRRGSLCAKQTGKGTAYLDAKTKVHKALRRWEPSEMILCRLVGHFKHQGGRVLVADVRHENERLGNLLGFSEVPGTVRRSLEAWRDAAWPIVSRGESESWDGCYWLLHADKLQDAMFAPGAAPEVRQAAGALVAWLGDRAQHAPVYLTPATAKPDTGIGTIEPAETNFAIYLQGDTYRIEGFGESGNVRRLKGFDIIARLTQVPSTPVPMAELDSISDTRRRPPDHRSYQPAMDMDAKKAAYDRLQVLRGECAKAKEENDNVEAAHCEEEIDKVTKELQVAIGIGHRDRDLNSEANKLRPKIYSALKTAYGILRKAASPMTELANHFDTAISSEGGCFIYRPPMPVEWSDSYPRKK